MTLLLNLVLAAGHDHHRRVLRPDRQGRHGQFSHVAAGADAAGHRIVLTVGMAVDANVLIFERIREKCAPASAGAAISAGYDKAFSTIWTRTSRRR